MIKRLRLPAKKFWRQLLRLFADRPLQALAGDAGAVRAAEDGGLGRAHVVAVQARDGERLEDMQLDQFHDSSFPLLGLTQEIGAITSRPKPNALAEPTPRVNAS